MGFSSQLRFGRAAAIGLALWLGSAGVSQAREALPGPPLETTDAARPGAWCPAPAPRSAGWNAAGFGLAAVAIGWASRRRDPTA